MHMPKSIEISVSRTFPKDQVRPEWLKKSPDGTFTAGPVDRDVPADLDEAIQKYGKVEVYNTFMKQVRLDLQNELASDIADKVVDPTKVNRRSAKAVKVDLS
jgi:hypothetical protein